MGVWVGVPMARGAERGLVEFWSHPRRVYAYASGPHPHQHTHTHRQQYLDQFGKKETDKRFLEYASNVEIDWEAIKAKKAQEKQDEQARSGSLTAPNGK